MEVWAVDANRPAGCGKGRESSLTSVASARIPFASRSPDVCDNLPR